jgi:hypothetical protein
MRSGRLCARWTETRSQRFQETLNTGAESLSHSTVEHDKLLYNVTYAVK